MHWKTKRILPVLLFLLGCNHVPTQQPPEEILSTHTSPYLIEADLLQKNLTSSHYKLLDFRKPSAYQQGHLPGALQIWRADLENPDYPYGGMMPAAAQVNELFRSMGIQNSDTLIIYDDNGLCDAARLWWILQYYDFTQVKLLNGGLTAWQQAGGVLTQDIPPPSVSSFTLTANPSKNYWVSREAVQAANLANITLLDTRSTEEHTGQQHKSGAMRAGRIPGSINIDWAHAINYHSDKKFKPLHELQTVYAALNSTAKDTIYVYCHSGVRSAHTTFVLTQLLGYQHVMNYDGSWTEWSYFDKLTDKGDSLTTLLN